jgi:release factor glutamine methyltransferase
LELSLAQRQWKLLELLDWSAARLYENEINDARLNAERLLAHVLGLNRIDLYLDYERPLTTAEIQKFISLFTRRLDREPLQYILGEVEFMSLPFKVTPDVLIPRSETEILVENAITQITKYFGKEKGVSCLDIGTGSGNIAISLAHYLKNVRVWAVDINESTLAVARRNAELNGVVNRVHFHTMNATLSDFPQQIGRKFDVLVSNPPYISDSEYRTLPPEIQHYEPKRALDGGMDGCQFYFVLRQNVMDLLKPKSLALIEIGANQAEKVIEIFTDTFPGKIEILCDLVGRDRVLLLSH